MTTTTTTLPVVSTLARNEPLLQRARLCDNNDINLYNDIHETTATEAVYESLKDIGETR